MHMSKIAKSKSRKAGAGRTGRAAVAKVKTAKRKAAAIKAGTSKPARAKVAARAAKRAAKPAGKPAGRSTRRSPEAMLAELKRRLLEISDLNFSNAVLGWDQATYMPPGGAEARGRQAAMLSKLAHERSVDPALGRLIDDLTPHA